MDYKVTHLPHVKRQLEQLKKEVNFDIKDQLYEDALQKINILIEQQFANEYLFEKKLYCLAMLERWDKVEIVAEQLMKEISVEKYEQILFYYVMSLYHNEQYELAIELIEEARNDGNISEAISEKLHHLYAESKQMTIDKAKKIDERMQIAMVTNNEPQQWQLFHQWKKLNVQPSELIFHMLESELVHPFVKTQILFSLQERKIEQVVTIVKNNKKMMVNVSDLPLLHEHLTYLKTLQHIEEVEQNDPTLHSLVTELLRTYFEFIYPFIYNIKNAQLVAQSAVLIARNHLSGQISEQDEKDRQLLYYKNEIERSHEAFFRLTIS